MNEEKLSAEQRADLVEYYFERAHESIKEAKYLKMVKRKKKKKMKIKKIIKKKKRTNLIKKKKIKIKHHRPFLLKN